MIAAADATETLPSSLARQPPNIHWYGQSTINVDSKIEMYPDVFNVFPKKSLPRLE